MDSRSLLIDGLAVPLPIAPAPRNAAFKSLNGHILNETEQVDDLIARFVAKRCEGKRAVAGNDSGHAVERQRVAPRIPEDRWIDVRMRVDESRRDIGTRRIEFTLALRLEARTDFDDPTVAHAHIRLHGLGTPAVDKCASTNQKIPCCHGPAPHIGG